MNIGIFELLIIIIIIIFFGLKRIPFIGRSLGIFVREAKKVDKSDQKLYESIKVKCFLS